MPKIDDSARAHAALAAYRAAAPGKREALKQPLMDALAPIVYAKAEQAFKSSGGGTRSGVSLLASGSDLANAWIIDLLSADEILPMYHPALGPLEAYIHQSLVNRMRSENRKDFNPKAQFPRIFVREDEDGTDAYSREGLSSQRRTPSAYLQLRQMCEILPRYLLQIPGKVVLIKKANDDVKRTILTRNHQRLLSFWLGTEGALTWLEVAERLGQPRQTVTRWFDEIKAHFKSDMSADAVFLRSLVVLSKDEPAADPQGQEAH